MGFVDCQNLDRFLTSRNNYYTAINLYHFLNLNKKI